MSERPSLAVVAGVLRDAAGRVLIAQRPPGKAEAGRWEFPGGKRAAGESDAAALRRELAEELGITPLALTPGLILQHDYPTRRVRMACFLVDAWRGMPVAREGQALAWVAPDDLPQWDILEADAPLIAALRLPDRLLITPDGLDVERLIAGLEAAQARGVRWAQLRAKALDPVAYAALAAPVLAWSRAAGVTVLLNCAADTARALGARGLHLDAARLAACEARPEGFAWVSASAHGAADLARIHALGLDCALLGPVQTTASHPAAEPLGWERCAALTRDAGLPVYALGGLAPRDLARARAHGAQGIAAIRGLWPGS